MLTPQLDLDAFTDVPFPVATRKELRKAGMLRVEAMGKTLCVLWNDGKPRVFADQCAHLGLPLTMGSVGKEGLRCSYHGWLYDTDTGEVREQPTLVQQRTCRLQRYGSLLAGGLVFCWLGDPADEEAVRARAPAGHGVLVEGGGRGRPQGHRAARGSQPRGAHVRQRCRDG
jgi:phenylpropionate dioxygenase-like ring-hydroxylating dioxygenase large terminal subunit